MEGKVLAGRECQRNGQGYKVTDDMPTNTTTIFGLLDLMNTDDSDLCFIDSMPTGSNFDSTDGSGARRGESVAKVWPADARCDMSPEVGGMKLADFVGNTVRLLIVHERIKNVMERTNEGKIEYLPLSIFNHKKRLASKDFFVVNPLGTDDVLDLGKSKIQRSGKDIVDIDKMILDPEKMKRAPDIFRPREAPTSYIISKRVAAALLKLVPKPVLNYSDVFDLDED